MKITVTVKPNARREEVRQTDSTTFTPPLNALRSCRRVTEKVVLVLATGFNARWSRAGFTVSVNESPVEGRANAAVQRLLAEYFDIAHNRIRIAAGRPSKKKIFEIM